MNDNKPFLTTEDFIQHFDKFRSGLFRASLDHYLQTGLPSGSLYLSINKYNEKANAKIAELEEWSKKQNDFIDKLGQENQKLREERDTVEQILEVVSQRWKDYPGSTVGIIGRKAKELLEQFKQSQK